DVRHFREQMAIVRIKGSAAGFRGPGGGKDGPSAGGGWGHPLTSALPQPRSLGPLLDLLFWRNDGPHPCTTAMGIFVGSPTVGLAPEDAGDLFDKVLLCWALRNMLSHQRLDDCPV